jgi:hypothetical protein
VSQDEVNKKVKREKSHSHLLLIKRYGGKCLRDVKILIIADKVGLKYIENNVNLYIL